MTLLAQIVFAHDSGLPEDVTVNTLHFEGAANGVVAQDISEAIVDFYNTAGVTSGTAIGPMLSSTLSGAVTNKFYDLTDAQPRTPFHEDDWVVVPGATLVLPSEVAICASFHGPFPSGVNRANRRNRIYLGPLNRDITGTTNPAAGRPRQTYVDGITDAMVRLEADSDSNLLGWTWVVYSPTLDVSATVVGGWVDDAFDTQRRRGLRATVRSEWTA